MNYLDKQRLIMKCLLSFWIISNCLIGLSQKPRPDKTLQKKTQSLIKDFKRDAGVFVKIYVPVKLFPLTQIQFFLLPV